MDKYLDLAYKYDAALKIFRCEGNFKNIHSVPENKIKIMKQRFEDYPGENKI